MSHKSSKFFGIALLLAACGDTKVDQRTTGLLTPEAVAVDHLDLGISNAEMVRIQDYLGRRIPSNAVVDSRMLNGEEVDCVDMYQQHGFKALGNAGLKEGIRKPPPAVVAAFAAERGIADDAEARGLVLQEPCPEGSVPMRRIYADEIVAFGGLDSYLDKEPPAIDTHEYAVTDLTTTNWGAEAYLNIWSPTVQSSGDFSLSQIWVSRGAGSDTETVEAGWIRRTGSLSRLFVFFTPDNYKKGGGSCWNNDCGFIQTNFSVVLDSTFTNYSVSGGSQYSTKFSLLKNTDTGDWWFGIEGVAVGYWPRTLFDSTGMRNRGGRITWGGEIYDLSGASHATTDMGGDGSFASARWQHAAYQRTMKLVETNGGSYVDADPDSDFMTDEDCYSMESGWDGVTNWHRYIYFGGTGFSGICP